MKNWFYDEQHEQRHISEALSPDDGDLFAADLERIRSYAECPTDVEAEFLARRRAS